MKKYILMVTCLSVQLDASQQGKQEQPSIQTKVLGYGLVSFVYVPKSSLSHQSTSQRKHFPERMTGLYNPMPPYAAISGNQCGVMTTSQKYTGKRTLPEPGSLEATMRELELYRKAHAKKVEDEKS